MTGLCLAAGLLLAPLGKEITLRWTHSIEKVVWEEDYRRENAALRLVEARVRGTGAGMEPPAGAVLRDGAWHYAPDLPPLPRISLRHSPYVPPYVVCAAAGCRPLPDWLPGLPAETVVEIAPCPNE
ncbi:MAG: DUF1850 domain-containing protein [Azospira sp.]|jgi:hypothetical protein|nr:DUF1850 domain-containing protein [Azospira sp.]